VTAAGRRVLVDCDGAAARIGLAVDDWPDRRQVRSDGPSADLFVDLTALGGAILKTLSPLGVDLLRLAAYVYRADQIVSRGGGRDVHAAWWRRHLTLCVPVIDPEFWSAAGVLERLTAALRFLTDDIWEFAFAAAPKAQRQVPLAVPTEEVIGQPTTVVPISGGTDSLCVLLETAANGGRPVAVSHWSTEAHKARQLALLAQVRQRFRHWDFPLLGLPLHGVGEDPPDSSQRSRGFLYAALATAVAGELGVERVLFGDNGPVSINLPINDQLVGALASRSTHPLFLYRFNQLASELYPTRVEVANPLQERTRAEALQVLKFTRCADLLPMTLSCSKWRALPAATPQCGECSQCVDRRFATVAAGLEEYDPVGRYRRDVFLDEPVHWEAVETAQSYVRFAQRVYPLGEQELTEACPQLYDLPTPDDADPRATIRGAVDLVKRHAAATLDVFKMMVSRHADTLAEGRLPPGCLLRKAIGGAELAATVPGDERPDPVLPQPAALPFRVTAAVARAENVFAYEGQLWTLSYGGVTKHMRESKGLTRLAVLLREPRREFSAEELLLAAEGAAGETLTRAEAERFELRAEDYAGGGTKLDQRALEAYKEENVRLLRELDQARDKGDAEEAEVLEARIRQIVQEMKAGTGPGRTLKPFVENRSRRRDSVYHSLYRVLPQVRKTHPALGEHLARSVHLRAPYSYTPEGTISWRVVLPLKHA
jgi:7-cyano-7-deazaguanine synthase in queuosine biosynthesis